MASYLFDTEANGLVHNVTKMHLLGMRDVDTRETFVFRQNDVMDNIAEGLERLQAADRIIGHNIINYDIKAGKKLYPWFKPRGEILDTLVLSRIARPNIAESDSILVKRGLFPGKMTGSHSLKAWGMRLGKHKGDYAEDMEKAGLDPWASWNQPMEDYMIGDLDVTEVLWIGIQGANLPAMTIDMEHEIHEIMEDARSNGFPFDVEAARLLAPKLQSEAAVLEKEIVDQYGSKLVPVKKYVIGPLWDDPDGINKKKVYKNKPRAEFGEDYSRAWWGDVVVPKVNHHDKKKGQPYCLAQWQTFNPGSRPQIIDRFVDYHDWKPQDFTDAGNPSVDDAVLKKLAEIVPAAKPIAELFFLNKLVAMMATGPQNWISAYNPDTGCVHTTTNTGGAVTGRCTHSHFNIGQIPGVMVGKDKHPILGRAGEYGYECRSFFRVPPGVEWLQCGIDLSGIEFRCLAELVSEFDGGELIDVVLTGDIHAYNQEKTGIPLRETVKRVLYGLLYGAGDYKLGVTANPLLDVAEAIKLGRSLRDALMVGLPALKKAIDKVKRDASRGYLIGLDGRRITVRSEYAALNTRLQSDAALIAKMWTILTRQKLVAKGYRPGWDGEFSLLAFIHDENQYAARTEIAKIVGDTCIEAAAEAGLVFGFKCPIDAVAKYGKTWAECH